VLFRIEPELGEIIALLLFQNTTLPVARVPVPVTFHSKAQSPEESTHSVVLLDGADPSFVNEPLGADLAWVAEKPGEPEGFVTVVVSMLFAAVGSAFWM